MKSIPIFPGVRPLMAIGYKYNSRKVLGFIATKGDRSTEPGYPYLSRFPGIYSNVSVFTVVCPHLIVIYLNACNSRYNQNMMQYYDLALDKYWVTQSGYFRIETTVELGIGITYGRILFCHGISEESVDKKISTRYYNRRIIYE